MVCIRKTRLARLVVPCWEEGAELCWSSMSDFRGIAAGARRGASDLTYPAAWDAGSRAKLRREAEAANTSVELQPCQRLSDYSLRYAPPK